MDPNGYIVRSSLDVSLAQATFNNRRGALMFVALLVLLIILHLSFYLISAVITALFSVLSATLSKTDNRPTDRRLTVANQLIVNILIGALLGATVQNLLSRTNASPEWLYVGSALLYVSILLTFNFLDKATGVTSNSSAIERGASEGALLGAVAGPITYWLAYIWPEMFHSAGSVQATAGWLVDIATGLAGGTLVHITAIVLVVVYLIKSVGALLVRGTEYAEGARATVDRML